MLAKRINPLIVLFFRSYLIASIFAQERKDEPVIMVTESGIWYEVAGWNGETIYDTTSY
jgi:hypothetical protein